MLLDYLYCKKYSYSKIASTKYFISIIVFVVRTRTAHSGQTLYFIVQSIIMIKQFKKYLLNPHTIIFALIYTVCYDLCNHLKVSNDEVG